ncbi:MarR family transcriptional regulator [Streptomyces sp. SID14478]|uniref:MarR family winged helix-turn-helix transcriptional regulator n=1 Tax=Streptomyces sp. SID14478 TaxID=2706073 RepID=UPI0013DA711F|nr:MarR family transcriptional regulator [Streptomyces sp. SID14478]NEB79905.1 MarR family transcriptional regulator [Streptomyces sp. SID14478]
MHKRVMDRCDVSVSPEELIGAVEQLVRHVRRGTVAGGLSTAASSALGRLGREGPHRLTDLARAEGASQPGMTQLVTRMERAGLVLRRADEHDGRGVLVEITEAGAQVLWQRRAERAGILQDLIEDMTEAEQQAVRIALPALSRVIQDRPAP